MAEAGLQEVETYVSRGCNTVTQFIVTRPIVELCLTAERRPGSRVDKQWGEQEGLYFVGIQTTAQKADASQYD